MKKTYIDQIFHNNSKKNFPKPGPADHFMDIIAAKKFYKSDPNLFTIKQDIEKKKSTVALQRRDEVIQQIEKHSKQVPAPGYSQKDVSKVMPVIE